MTHPNEKSHDDDRVVPVKQMAKMLSVSPLTLYRWRENGSGPPYIRLSHARIGYPMDAFRAWKKIQTINS